LPVRRQRAVEPDLTWTGEAFESSVAVGIGADGRISSVGPPPAGGEIERLRGRALLPGFVDVHSHAFQIGLRGKGESFPAGRGTFWSWREAMYELVGSLDAERLLALSARTFREMRAAGITSIGEFHYLHHADAGAADFALDEAVIEAARDAGIRLVLLESYYRTGGPGRPLEGGQRRFDGVSVESFLAHVERLESALDPARETLGVAPHSLRAATPDEISELDAYAARRGWPLHLHLEEQRRELEEVEAAYGRRPVELVLDALGDGGARPRTGIHLTHTSPELLGELFARGWTAGLCPLTEGDLGDGVPSLCEVEGPRRLALGSDSNLRISMLENLRWLEHGQRLRAERRGMLAERPAVALLEASTAGGAASLGLPAGRILPGLWADFALVDLAHPALAEVPPAELPEALVFGAPDDVIVATAVGGRWLEHRPPAGDRQGPGGE
jgi:formimidoylglutamate deiminase